MSKRQPKEIAALPSGHVGIHRAWHGVTATAANRGLKSELKNFLNADSGAGKSASETVSNLDFERCGKSDMKRRVFVALYPGTQGGCHGIHPGPTTQNPIGSTCQPCAAHSFRPT
jgi:hypothetical protein